MHVVFHCCNLAVNFVYVRILTILLSKSEYRVIGRQNGSHIHCSHISGYLN